MRGLLVVVCALGMTSAAAADPLERPLEPAALVRTTLPARPHAGERVIDGRAGDWHGALAHLAGTSHYAGGEWIAEDHRLDAYGAATPGSGEAFALAALPGAVDADFQRLSGISRAVVRSYGAGPLDAADDLAQVRVAISDDGLAVLARPAPTHLVVLLDTRPGTTSHEVGFDTGLTTTQADVVARITAHGTTTVDLASGKQWTSAGAAGTALEGLIPAAALGDAERPRVVFASGSPIANVVPRPAEPINPVYDQQQAAALEAGSIDRFLTPVSLARLRRGDRVRLTPRGGYAAVTVGDSEYGLYLPASLPPRGMPATLFLHGSDAGAHDMAVLSPGLFHALGDTNGAAVIVPAGGTPLSLFEGDGYVDVLRVLADARRRLHYDRNRLTLAGYSMGGYGAYLLAQTQPDRFAAAFVIEGPVGGSHPNAARALGYETVNQLPGLSALRWTPVEIYQGTNDANVPIDNGQAAADRLRALGFRYRLRLLAGEEHQSPVILDQWDDGARYLALARRRIRPPRVRLVRRLGFEHIVNAATGTDGARIGADRGLRFDRAWYVRRLVPAHVRATARVRTYAVPAARAGVEHDSSLPGDGNATLDQQTWTRPTGRPVRRNAFRARFTGARSVTLRLRQMGLRPHGLRGAVETTTWLRLRLGRRTYVLAPGLHLLANP